MTPPTVETALRELVLAAKAVFKDKPMVECNNFHHSKSDQHSHIFDCPVENRWEAAMDNLQINAIPAAEAALKEAEKVTIPVCGGCGTHVYDTWNFCPRCGAGCKHPEDMIP